MALFGVFASFFGKIFPLAKPPDVFRYAVFLSRRFGPRVAGISKKPNLEVQASKSYSKLCRFSVPRDR